MGGCKNKKLISPYLDGQLGDCHWLDEHISECSECLAEYEAIQRINHLAQKADCSLPESSYWRNFSGRVTNRVITREAEAHSHRVRQIFTEWKVLLRPAMFASALLLAIVTFIALYHSGNAPIIGDTDKIAIQVPIKSPANSFPENITSPSKQESIAVAAKGGNHLAIKEDISTRPKIIDDNATKTSMNPVNAFSPILPSGAIRPIYKTGADLVESDIKVIDRPDLVNYSGLSSDQVISFQIYNGSNPSMIPLSYYRQAVTKFFGPEKTASSRGLERPVSNSWGYAVGGALEDTNSINRLNLELELIKDK